MEFYVLLMCQDRDWDWGSNIDQ